MKSTINLLSVALMFCIYGSSYKTDPVKNITVDKLNKSGYVFDVNVSRINSKYSEIASAVFRNKLVIVSSKKIGGLNKNIDPITKEPYTDLFCMDIKQNSDFSPPLLFSRILNTKANEGQVAFSLDGHTIYYTRSDIENTKNYKLYKATLEKDSYGKWENHMELAISSNDYSVENPHISADGNFLYFSSNMAGGFGGFDLYKSDIHEDGSIGNPINLGSFVNSAFDEKYPHTSERGKELFFSSTGYNSIGGYDVFISNMSKGDYSKPRNLGTTINSQKDEIGFMIINDKTGVFSSDKNHATNGFNMYHFKAEAIYRELQGVVVTEDDRILPNSTVVLLNDEGKEIERQTTSIDASYRFKIKAFGDYQLVAVKEGFDDYALRFESEENKLRAVLRLTPNVTYNKSKP
ncbi:carboxypeptidase-like regulatory domain-containing protein [uncultured Winogradskyella sp.]|uniref:carboxypeptidase-like regulatory domain-containing protein n=1 Tax=uncultured Winogradskyella sp. TaxID=395353 RepID=UPI00261EB298|nr:carboxypeptidase-like regulatory domain-containing protein [uncultured Winogradskyella sp.]